MNCVKVKVYRKCLEINCEHGENMTCKSMQKINEKMSCINVHTDKENVKLLRKRNMKVRKIKKVNIERTWNINVCIK